MKSFGIIWTALFIVYVPVAMRWDERLKAQRLLRNIVKTLETFRLELIDLNTAAIAAGKSMRKFMETIKGMNS